MSGWRKSSYSHANGNCVEARTAWRKSSHSNGHSECVEVSWRKSSRSVNNGECVEVGDWRKATASQMNGGCVEAGTGRNVILVRDTKDAHSPELPFSLAAWREFIGSVKHGG